MRSPLVAFLLCIRCALLPEAVLGRGVIYIYRAPPTSSPTSTPSYSSQPSSQPSSYPSFTPSYQPTLSRQPSSHPSSTPPLLRQSNNFVSTSSSSIGFWTIVCLVLILLGFQVLLGLLLRIQKARKSRDDENARDIERIQDMIDDLDKMDVENIFGAQVSTPTPPHSNQKNVVEIKGDTKEGKVQTQTPPVSTPNHSSSEKLNLNNQDHLDASLSTRRTTKSERKHKHRGGERRQKGSNGQGSS